MLSCLSGPTSIWQRAILTCRPCGDNVRNERNGLSQTLLGRRARAARGHAGCAVPQPLAAPSHLGGVVEIRPKGRHAGLEASFTGLRETPPEARGAVGKRPPFEPSPRVAAAATRCLQGRVLHVCPRSRPINQRIQQCGRRGPVNGVALAGCLGTGGRAPRNGERPSARAQDSSSVTSAPPIGDVLPPSPNCSRSSPRQKPGPLPRRQPAMSALQWARSGAGSSDGGSPRADAATSSAARNRGFRAYEAFGRRPGAPW